jgi:hypothetical protein
VFAGELFGALASIAIGGATGCWAFAVTAMLAARPHATLRRRLQKKGCVTRDADEIRPR